MSTGFAMGDAWGASHTVFVIHFRCGELCLGDSTKADQAYFLGFSWFCNTMLSQALRQQRSLLVIVCAVAVQLCKHVDKSTGTTL